MRQGRVPAGTAMQCQACPEHGEGSSTTIQTGLVNWHSSHPLVQPVEQVWLSCRVVQGMWAWGNKQPLSLRTIRLRCSITESSPVPTHAAQRRMQGHVPPLVWTLRVRGGGSTIRVVALPGIGTRLMPRFACGCMSVKLRLPPSNKHSPAALFPATRTVEPKPGRDSRHDPRARQVAAAVAQVPGVTRVLLFGSRARGDHVPGSDIDLLVVGNRTSAVADACRRVAAQAARNVYTAPPAVDVTVLDTAHFDFMQHGLNHMAAFAAREGVTSMGDRYKPPKPPPDHRPETLRREAMERAAYARDNLLFLEETLQRDISRPGIPFNWDRFLGRDAQGALEHALKAVIAVHGRKYEHTHKLPELLEAAQVSVPTLTLTSNLEMLSAFVVGTAYESPDLNEEVEYMVQCVRYDVTQMFDICMVKGDFDPWTVIPADYRRGD